MKSVLPMRIWVHTAASHNHSKWLGSLSLQRLLCFLAVSSPNEPLQRRAYHFMSKVFHLCWSSTINSFHVRHVSPLPPPSLYLAALSRMLDLSLRHIHEGTIYFLQQVLETSPHMRPTPTPTPTPQSPPKKKISHGDRSLVPITNYAVQGGSNF